MRKKVCFIKLISLGITCLFVFCGCSGKHVGEKELKVLTDEKNGQQGRSGYEDIKEMKGKEEVLPEDIGVIIPEDETGALTETVGAEPEITEKDWTEYFDDYNGAAVLYDTSAGRFLLYNSQLALTRRSPCSTFKIISSLIALENGIIEPDNSTHTWSGEIFWNENWNHDIDFREAFRESCVWYFREVTDEIGQELMQEELLKLMYGNQDISDWEGRQNTNNNNRALTGFWIESSLMISPKEQTEVMERIFGEESPYSADTLEELKKVMLVPGEYETEISIYGKTGMGMAEGVVVDAWFTGFAESGGKNIYFCVYLGRTDNVNVSSTAAKEIAIRLISDYFI